MTESDEIDNLNVEMEEFLQAIARRTPTPAHPIHLRIDFKNNLRVIDSSKHTFGVDESVLSPFRDTYIDKQFKTIRLHNWEFEIEFEGKRVKEISLIAESVIFIGSKNVKKEISGCHFKIRILEKDEETKRFTPELNGYLNRLGKRHLCSYSHNIAKDLPSLATFIPLDNTPKLHFAYKPYVKPGSNTLEPLSTINNEGRKILEKLRHFVTRQEIYNFIVEQEVSEEAVTELRKMAVGGK